MIVGGFWAGVLLLFVVTPIATQIHRRWRRMWQAAMTATLTCAQLQETTLPWVAVAARTSAREITSAPLSGAPCICYWTDLEQLSFGNAAGDSESRGVTSRDAGRIVIEDDTGTAVVDKELAVRGLTGRRDRLAIKTIHNWTTKHTQDSGHEQFREKVGYVSPDVPVYVIGSVYRDGDGPPRLGGDGGTSTRTPGDVLDRLLARDSWWAGVAQASALAGLCAISATIALILIGIR